MPCASCSRWSPRAPTSSSCAVARRGPPALRQAIADVVGCTVVELADEHAALIGATVVAHLALGAEPPALGDAMSVTTPDDVRQAVQARSASLFDEVLPTLAPTLSRIVGLRAGPIR